jgi:hypothetical protein
MVRWVKELDSKDGYLFSLNLPYKIATFCVSHGHSFHVFLLANEECFDARHYYPQFNCGSDLRLFQNSSF